jgi:hypothetical protein
MLPIAPSKMQLFGLIRCPPVFYAAQAKSMPGTLRNPKSRSLYKKTKIVYTTLLWIPSKQEFQEGCHAAPHQDSVPFWSMAMHFSSPAGHDDFSPGGKSNG